MKMSFKQVHIPRVCHLSSVKNNNKKIQFSQQIYISISCAWTHNHRRHARYSNCTGCCNFESLLKCLCFPIIPYLDEKLHKKAKMGLAQMRVCILDALYKGIKLFTNFRIYNI